MADARRTARRHYQPAAGLVDQTHQLNTRELNDVVLQEHGTLRFNMAKRGHPQLRSQLAARYQFKAEDLIITNGSQQALNYAGRYFATLVTSSSWKRQHILFALACSKPQE